MIFICLEQRFLLYWCYVSYLSGALFFYLSGALILTCLEVIKLFSCSTQLSMKFILRINVKMTTIVDILTFISRINTSVSLKARKISILVFMSS